ncbi:RNA polymerase sigma factor [Dyadobacter jiangsuensis]|uniref:RNA polymerase sigma-70 factor (ECF subfamily) n=1 Tax=Dyadobacter jiangsuensis TaxID=1591085 RepID=A0A2P8GB10_9BACT|nr:RNA polymerase sigma-70 factor [Dyadobacter jiangsuensis]PSL31161.1 RNA polymerase sigma-70 factor (ECF subfamily) [Dyadobacter jiangsuensis]
MQPIVSDDIRLVQLLVQGDKAGFEEIYNRYHPKLYRIALSKVRTQENAMELVQDVFLDLWVRRGEVEITDLERYLCSAIKYKVLDHFKKEFHRKRYMQFAQLGNLDQSSSTEETLAFNELTRSVLECIDKLPEKTRKIFELSRIQHTSSDEISTLLNIPLRTVEYHISQGLKALRSNLKDYILLLMLTFWTWW